MSFFVYKRAATQELFAVHEEQGRNYFLPGGTQDADYTLASATPGFLGYRDNGGPGISDHGIRWWMNFFNIPASQWPANLGT